MSHMWGCSYGPVQEPSFVYLFVCDLAAVGGLQLPPFGDGKMPEPRGGVASSSVRVHIDRSVGVVVGRAALAGGALWRLRVCALKTKVFL